MAKRNARRGRGEGSVFFSEAKQCWIWRACTGFNPDGSIRHTEGRARTQADAVKAKRDAEKKNRLPESDRTTVGEYLAYWLEDVAKPNVRSSTFGSYERVVRLHLTPHIGGIRLKQLGKRDVTRLWAALSRSEMSAGNVRKCSEVLASAMEHAAAEDMIDFAPTRSAVKPQVVKQPIEVFSDEEVERILNAARGDRLEVLYTLAVGTGMREGELLALEAADVDSDSVHVRRTLDESGRGTQPPKSASGVRIIGLPAFAAKVLTAWTPGRSGPLFTTGGGNYFLRSNFVRKEWAPLLKAAGVPYRKFHALRHTHASRLLAEGVDPAEVARRLGDRVETIMRTYAHWINVKGRDTAAKIDAIYGPKGPRLAKLPVAESVPEGGGKVAEHAQAV